MHTDTTYREVPPRRIGSDVKRDVSEANMFNENVLGLDLLPVYCGKETASIPMPRNWGLTGAEAPDGTVVETVTDAALTACMPMHPSRKTLEKSIVNAV